MAAVGKNGGGGGGGGGARYRSLSENWSPALIINQRTNDPVNAYLISWPSKALNIKNRKIYGKEMTLTFNTHIPS